MSLSFKEIADLEVGDVLVESSQYGDIYFKVASEPVVEYVSGLDRSQVSFDGVSLKSGDTINYLLTEGLEHYGPRIYREPAYMSAKELRNIDK